MALFDRDAVADLLCKQNGVITRSQAKACRMSESALRHRLRSGGPWQVLLPGVYLASTGAATNLQREVAAVLYGGPGSVITGPSALALHRIRVPRTPTVNVLIPQTRQRHNVGFVQLSRTSRMPALVFPQDGVYYVPPARAVADTVRGLRDLGAIRAIVADGVQRGIIPLRQLVEELDSGPKWGSARFRQVLQEVADGIRSAAEGDLHTLVTRERLPEPMYNPRLYAGGMFIGSPDVWWAEAGVAGEVESRAWHLSPADWERTLARDARMSAHGIVVLHFSPSRLHKEPRVVAAEIRSALEAGRSRGHLEIKALPARR
jgi:hypothetical protein